MPLVPPVPVPVLAPVLESLAPPHREQAPTIDAAQVGESKEKIKEAIALTKNLGTKIGNVAKRVPDVEVVKDLMQVKSRVDTITKRLEWYMNPKITVPALIALACTAAALIAAVVFGAPIVVPIAVGAAAVGFGAVAIRNYCAHKKAQAAPPVLTSA